ncbi:SS-A/Ro ribonucleoprotein [Promicromonospora umidemergens]|uniref:TROVE domain-containing protein n=1 Tax=Promicromonospora umidemergens TaxID=629679 RepID=A0ABP8Y5I7_9MICO|nr:TROVE domain-containing protein [Promicromonospora umidemergens]MCP2282480.1 SS-A/Ro ribonucleoprotein [Promicromonospora umidemergens]
MDILRAINRRRTPQNQPADPRQEANSAGGYTFVLDDAARLRRFLTLGVDGGTYYAAPGTLARENAEVVARMAAADPVTLVDTIVEVSTSGAAPKQNPALFALAYAASVPESAALALAALPRVARTGTHLFLFAGYVEQFRGWGRGLRRAVGGWYTAKDADAVAYQAVKYRQREGWSHRDLLRLAHPVTADSALRATFDWVVRGATGEQTPALVTAFLRAQEATAPAAWSALVREAGLTWEMLPDAALAEPAVWDALLDVGMPATALMRQLPRLTRLGLLPAVGGRTDEVASLLADPERLRRAPVHPVNVLVARRTYASGVSARGTGTWEPTQRIVDALDAAFYAAFGAVEPAGKRMLLAVDVSGSMGTSIAGMPLTAREASAALALVQLATEPGSSAVGFTTGPGQGWRESVLKPLRISPRRRLDDALRVVDEMPMGGTDCAQPMLYALANGMEVDTFVVYTDSETWHGDVHPHQALRQYRERTAIAARLVVVGMTATEFSIADPTDPGMLDVAGFDAAVPSVISQFARGL